MTQLQQDTTQVEVTVATKRTRGRPQLTEQQWLEKETLRLAPLMAHEHNSNPLSVAKSGVTSTEQQMALAASKASSTEKVKLTTYGVRKSAKQLTDAITNAVAQGLGNAQIAMVVYSTRNTKNKLTQEVSDTLQRIANGETFEKHQLPKALQQYA